MTVSALSNEKKRYDAVKAKIDFTSVNELVDKVPFPIMDWKQAEVFTLDPSILEEEGTVLLEMLMPFIRSLVVVNYLQQHLKEKNKDAPWGLAHHLLYAAPTDVVLFARGKIFLKYLLQDILDLNEVYDPVQFVMFANDPEPKGVWGHYYENVAKNDDFLALVALVEAFYAENVALYTPEQK